MYWRDNAFKRFINFKNYASLPLLNQTQTKTLSFSLITLSLSLHSVCAFALRILQDSIPVSFNVDRVFSFVLWNSRAQSMNGRQGQSNLRSRRGWVCRRHELDIRRRWLRRRLLVLRRWRAKRTQGIRVEPRTGPVEPDRHRRRIVDAGSILSDLFDWTGRCCIVAVE